GILRQSGSNSRARDSCAGTEAEEKQGTGARQRERGRVEGPPGMTAAASTARVRVDRTAPARSRHARHRRRLCQTQTAQRRASTTPGPTSRRWRTPRFTSMNGSTLVSTGELEDNLARWRVFDCRHDLAKPDLGEQQYGEGHIAGALFAHLERDLSGRKTGSN